MWAVVGLSGWLVGFYFASLVAWTLLKRQRPTHAIKWMRWLKKLRGWKEENPFKGNPSMLVAVAFAALCSGVLTFGMARSRTFQLHDVYVMDVAPDDPFRYHMRVDGHEFWTTFCSDYEPQFDKQQTLIVLTYEDFGSCWSVANTHPAYLIKRGPDGKPIKE
jgi:hypothetical protein